MYQTVCAPFALRGWEKKRILIYAPVINCKSRVILKCLPYQRLVLFFCREVTASS